MSQLDRPPLRKLCIFFDVDFTLITGEGKLRNHVRKVFERLTDVGHSIYIWSGVGIRRWEMERHDLGHFVTDYFEKPLWSHRERLKELGIPIMPDFVVDDHEEVVNAFGGYLIPFKVAPDDREMLNVLAAIEEAATRPAHTSTTASP